MNRSWLMAVLVVSLTLNLIGVLSLMNVIAGRGGIAYLKAVFEHDPTANTNPAYTGRQTLFERLPSPRVRPIVFVGDSLTAGCEWWEIFGHDSALLNRGIGGDTSAGVLARVDSIAALRPIAVFLMIGTNDPQLLGYTPKQTLANYEAILKRLHAASPDTVIILEALLPTAAPKFNKWSAEVNRLVRPLADGSSVLYLDFRDRFLAEGRIRSELTVDGIHLNGKGYQLWAEAVRSTVATFAHRNQSDRARK